MKKYRLLAFLLMFTMIISNINMIAFGESTKGIKYEIAISVDPDMTTIDLSTLETDLKTKMIEQFATQHSQTLTENDITIDFIEPNNIKSSNQGAWDIYDHYYSPDYEASSKTDADKNALLQLAGRTGQPFYYYKETSKTGSSSTYDANGFYTSPDVANDNVYFRDKHIYPEGNRATFMGYSSPAYKDFMFYPDKNSGSKTIEYSIYLDTVSPHTLSGAGFLVNTGITGSGSSATIDGYLIYYQYSGSSSITGEQLYVYKLEDVNVDTLHDTTTSITSTTGVSQIAQNLTLPIDGTVIKVKDIKIEVSNDKIAFYEKDGTDPMANFIEAISVDTNTTNYTQTNEYGFGPFVAYSGHGCPMLTIYKYDNINLTSNLTKTFEEKILEPKWHEGAIHGLININDSGIVNFDNNNARTEMLHRLINKDVHYIGWGTDDKVQELQFIKDNNNSGMYIDTSSAIDNVTFSDDSTSTAADYSAQVNEMAKYLISMLDYDINQTPVAKVAYDGTNLSSNSTDPNSDSLTEHWSLKEADDATWTLASDANDATSKLSTILGNTQKNVLVQLIVDDGNGNFSEPDVLYLSTQTDVKPLANFTIPETLDLETAQTTIITPNNTTFDPAVPQKNDMTYQWEVYDEMGSLSLQSTEYEPNLDFAGLSSGRYDITLTVAASSNTIESNTFIQSLNIIDTVAPNLIVSVTGNKDSAMATIKITDTGSGPDSYRTITTATDDTQISGPWVPAVATQEVTKTFAFVPSALKALQIEVKDGSGNIAIYDVEFDNPVIAFTPNGGNIYTNVTPESDIEVNISSLSNSAITKWYYKWLSTGTYPGDQDMIDSGTEISSSSLIVTKPVEMGDYYLHVLAYNDLNNTTSEVSESYTFTEKDSNINDLRITSSGSTTIDFAWSQPDSPTNQKIQLSTDDGLTWSDATHDALTDTSTSTQVTGLDPNTEYVFKLVITGGSDAGESNKIHTYNLIEYATGDTATNVNNNVVLTTTKDPGLTISWITSDSSIIDTDGNVFRPSYLDGEQEVTLIASINDGNSTYIRTYTLKVKVFTATDEEAVVADKLALEIGYADGDHEDSVTQNVTLSSTTTPSNGSTVTWASNKTGVIDTNGTITRPTNDLEDEVVTLTATITKNSAIETKIFVVTVKKQANTSESDATAIANLEIGYAPLDSASSVTQDVILPMTASNGNTVTWTSDNTSIIANDGTVTRQVNGSGNTIVTLTADINGTQRVFNLTVIQEPMSNNIALSDIEIGYASGDSASSVTQDVTLTATSSNGNAITWTSDNTSVIANDGTVTRPTGGSGDATVVLTATIGVETRTFNITVKEETTDATALTELEIGYADGDSASSITQDVTLPTTASNGSGVTWASDNAGIIANNGTVTRPTSGSGETTVVLTATVGVETRTFSLIVKENPQTDIEAVAADKALLDIIYATGDDINNVTQNVTLLTSLRDGSVVTWSSDNSTCIDTNGTVTRPINGSGDATVTLTATITKNDASDTKNFVLTVKELPADDLAAITELQIVYASGDSASSVTQDVILPTTASNGSGITWSSDDVISIADNGTVTRPVNGSGEATVVLTATVGAETRTFTLTVKEEPVDDATSLTELQIGYAPLDSASSVTQDVTLPMTSSNGNAVTWTSDDTSIIANDGTVTRLVNGLGNTIVSLTADINGTQRVFNLTVIQEPMTNNIAFGDIEIGYASGDSASSVTQDVTLIATSSNGNTVTWTSDNIGVIANDGIVTRPTGGSGDATVILTATIGIESRTFNITVKEETTDASALAELEIVYADGDSASSVTQNVTLPTTASNGSGATWASDNAGIIADDGTVTRPTSGSGEITVVLTATVGVETRTFSLIVKENPQTDIEAVAADKALLDIIYATGDDINNVTQNVTLLTSLRDGSVVTWSTDNSTCIDTNGIVARPTNGSGDATVTLTATITKNDASDTKNFVLTVKELPVDLNGGDVATDKAALEIIYASGDSAVSVTQNVTLPVNGANGTTITWQSSDYTLMDSLGNVFRPNLLQGDKTVILTATIQKGASIETKQFTLLIKALNTNNKGMVMFDKERLSIGYASGDSSTSVTKNVTLPLLGEKGSIVTWSSDNEGIISTTGQVTRPSYGNPDIMVKMTANLLYSDKSEIKIFNLIVKAKTSKPRPRPIPEPIPEPTPEPTKTGTVILVNGIPETAGEEETTEENGQKRTDVKVNTEVISKKIDDVLKEQSGNKNIIEVPVNTEDVDKLKVALTGDIVKKMETEDFDISIKTDKIDYVIPAEEVGIDNVADMLGISNEKLEEIEIEVNIDKVDEVIVNEITENAKAKNYEIVLQPIEFKVVAKTRSVDGEKRETTISRFNQYVTRIMEIPEGIDPNKITTGIVYNADGSFSHIPTEVLVVESKYFAKLNSLTNSSYSVIWNPITVDSVENHWSKVAVNDMASRLIIKNPDTFEANGKITRGEFAEYITKALGIYRTKVAKDNQFTDVEVTDELADSITIAVEYGIIGGYPDGSFKSDKLITREEAMVMYARAMKVIKLTGNDKERINNYTDYNTVGDWAKEDIVSVISAKVFNGTTPTTLSPKSYFTYAEAAQAIRNLLTESSLIDK